MRLHLLTLALCGLALLVAGCPGDAVEEVPAPVESTAPVRVEPPAPLPDDAVFSGFHDAVPGNLFVSGRAGYLYIAWSLPKDRAPLAGLDDPAQVESFLLNTALNLCYTHQDRRPPDSVGCLVHVLLLWSNDEYSKSAQGAWTSVGKVSAPWSGLDATTLEAQVQATVGSTRALFDRRELDLGLLSPPATAPSTDGPG